MIYYLKTNISVLFMLYLLFAVLPIYGRSTKLIESKGFDSEKAIAIEATIIAQNRLSKDNKDKVGLILMNLAKHTYPNYKTLLLLRAKLKYKLPIDPSEKLGTGEFEFVNFLKKRTSQLIRNTNQRDRHLSLIYCSIIRIFDPDDEKTLISLMKFNDLGNEMNIETLLSKKFSTMPYFELDPKDPRYAIDNVQKTIKVFANVPWNDTWIKVKSGKIVRIDAKRFWTLGNEGGALPYTDADGFDNSSMQKMVDRGNSGRKDKNYQKRYRAPKFMTKKLKGKRDMNPGCLLAKIGNEVIPVGKKIAFRAPTSGILLLGPFEWDSYNDNSGYLLVTITVSDK